MGPEISPHPLTRADGSTILSNGLYTVIASVNGPVEVQRRDELPEEAAIEVNVRPSSGIGGPRERWLESIIIPILKGVLLTNLHPRTLIQVTLQVTRQPHSELQSASANTSIIPILVNSAFVALADSGLPLSTTLVATLAVVSKDRKILVDPEEQDVVHAESIHALVYNGYREQVLDESWGPFNMDTWGQVAEATREQCDRALAGDRSKSTGTDTALTLNPWLRTVLEDHARAGTAWRGDGS